jgi:catechol 2,3-dioxygenase
MELGHVVLKVRDIERSARFYKDVVGLKEVARLGDSMAFFSFGEKHHDLGLLQLGPGAADAPERSVGLYHVAFKVGDGKEALRRVRERLERLKVPVSGASDHRVSWSLYVRDPDGILVELYADADEAVWKSDPSAVAAVGPLDL